jgi:hypothetical protein
MNDLEPVPFADWGRAPSRARHNLAILLDRYAIRLDRKQHEQLIQAGPGWQIRTAARLPIDPYLHSSRVSKPDNSAGETARLRPDLRSREAR